MSSEKEGGKRRKKTGHLRTKGKGGASPLGKPLALGKLRGKEFRGKRGFLNI